MKLGYTILYVDDVPGTITRWAQAFDLAVRFVTDDGLYGELQSGETTISFAERGFGREHFTDERVRASFGREPARFEIGFVTPEVDLGFARAVEHGMEAIVQPLQKPWGQRVAWVLDPNGFLIEIASPME